MKHRFCTDCGAELAANFKFCPTCGYAAEGAPPRSSARAPLGAKHFLGIVGIALALFGGAIGLSLLNSGTKPSFTEMSAAPKTGHSAPKEVENDPEIKSLRAAVEKEPTNKEGWETLAAALIERLQKTESPPPELVFASIDALAGVLKIDPNDERALLAMADLSFSNQAFPKAADFYRRYLEINPDDLDTRARYASAMTFTGNFDDSIKELETVLARDPKHFQAAAYLAITYARKGEKDRSRTQAEEALKLAPNDEARARFSGFLDTLDAETGKGPAPVSPRGNVKPTAVVPEVMKPIVDKVEQNPIAGRKFVRAEAKDKVLQLFFAEFPMDVMPPAVREKFLGGIREVAAPIAKSGAVSKVELMDEATGKLLSEVSF